MTAREMQIAFEREANLQDPTIKPTSDEIFYWINRAIETFIKTRWSGNNPKGEGFEQTQKRIDDLRTLIYETSIATVTGDNIPTGFAKPNSYIATIPSNLMFSLGEEVTISYVKNSVTIISREGITETTIDKYTDDIINPFSEHILHNDWARPLRLFLENQVELITDGTYSITYYHLRYLRKPTTVTSSTDCDLPSQTHYEIIKLANKMYLERIKDPRLQTYNNEIVTME